MRKTVATIIIGSTLTLAGIGPAVATNNLPCTSTNYAAYPGTNPIDWSGYEHMCGATFADSADRSFATLLENTINAQLTAISTLNAESAAKSATVEREQATIAQQRATIKRLRAKLARTH